MNGNLARAWLRPLCVTLLLVLSASWLIADIVPIANEATLTLPPNYQKKRTGTIDSDRGVISTVDGRFSIDYDIGEMAGLWVGPRSIRPDLGKDCLSYLEQEFNRVFSCFCLKKDATTQKEIAEISLGCHIADIRSNFNFPANFRTTVLNSQQLADFLLIVGSYNPRPKDVTK